MVVCRDDQGFPPSYRADGLWAEAVIMTMLHGPLAPLPLQYLYLLPLLLKSCRDGDEGTGCPFPSPMGRGRCRTRSNPRVPSGRFGGRRKADATAPAVVGLRGGSPAFWHAFLRSSSLGVDCSLICNMQTPSIQPESP